MAGVAAVVLSNEADIVLEHLAPAMVLFLGAMPAPKLVHKGIIPPHCLPAEVRVFVLESLCEGGSGYGLGHLQVMQARASRLMEHTGGGAGPES